VETRISKKRKYLLFNTIPLQYKNYNLNIGKVKPIPSQVWTGPEGSSRLRLPDFKTVST